ncbi:hypothetical protein BD309DRAFT_1027081 [Dichomitus squalens]|nr:hypothetical protein BD309DRAFT_1027081 [Dichomitus squalens]
MSRTSTHHYVSLLIPSFNAHADALVFRPYNGRDDAWASVPNRELEERIAVARAHWAPVLASLDIRPSDVVGFWLTGSKLSDLINSIAMSALGYTPQFFGGYFGNVSIVLDLLLKSGGKALIVDETYLPAASAASATTTIIVYRSLDYDELSQLVVKVLSGGRAQDLKLSEPEVSVGPDDIAVLFHSSGTTGGLPKIIPNTFDKLGAVKTRIRSD